MYINPTYYPKFDFKLTKKLYEINFRFTITKTRQTNSVENLSIFLETIQLFPNVQTNSDWHFQYAIYNDGLRKGQLINHS